MTIAKVFFASLLALSTAEQMVFIDWTAKNVPQTGLQDVSFPISMPDAPHESGYYFEQAVGFQKVGKPNGGADCLYTGLQPRPDQDGNSIIHAVFSSFLIDSTSTDPNCHSGSDANSYGVSCAIEIPASYDGDYELRISLVSNSTTYVGTLVESQSGQEWHIGTVEAPSSVSGMTQMYQGFVEYYYTNLGDCSMYPKTSVIFGTPTTTTPGVQISLGEPYANTDCSGKIPWTYNNLEEGVCEIIIDP